jgi:ceramide glucosyltransferase
MDSQTANCLRSWLVQEYRGPVQVLFGVASPEDPVCGVVRELISEHPEADAQLVICRQSLGPNAKVSSLVQLQAQAKHDVIVVSDADVRVPPDLLANFVQPLREPGVGLVNCFYELANPVNLPMKWEAVAVNSDFWTQVLQSQDLTPLRFALGAAMATTRSQLERIGGFASLVDYLADDYQLGNKVALNGSRIVLCSVAVQCWSDVMGWKDVWRHQLRWARTIRVCQPAPFFFSALSNGTFWPLVWVLLSPGTISIAGAVFFWLVRMLTAHVNQCRLLRRHCSWGDAWLVLLKDLAGIAIWSLAFTGNRIEWRGESFRMLPGGRLAAQR